jgi:diacylglycerol kinase (ATP)
LLIGSLLLVLIVELLNSAVEATVDRISKKHHKLSGRAKDMGSAAVYLSILLAILTWMFVLFDR